MKLDIDIWKVRIFSSISNLSRTSAGSANKAYSEKPALLITDPQKLSTQTAQNLARAIAYVWEQGPLVLPEAGHVRAFIDALSERVSDKLVAPEYRLRTWELDRKIYPAACSPERIPEVYARFCEGVEMILTSHGATQVRNANWIEREFDSELHPLADGCGRVAKLLGAWILLRRGKYPAHFDDRAEYYAAMRSSQRVWEKFYRDHLP
jgi:hypothetical protein